MENSNGHVCPNLDPAAAKLIRDLQDRVTALEDCVGPSFVAQFHRRATMIDALWARQRVYNRRQARKAARAS